MDTALILAGGESRRFGRPKAIVEIGGTPMVRRVVDVMASLVPDVIVSVASTEMEEELAGLIPEAKFAVDRRAGRGPIEGFRIGFELAHGERILVAPCDAPLLRRALYRLLTDAIGARDAAVPRLDAFDPVRAVYNRSAVQKILAEAEEVVSPSALVDRLDVEFVSAPRIRLVDPDLSSFLDVNTEEDLREVARRLSQVGD